MKKRIQNSLALMLALLTLLSTAACSTDTSSDNAETTTATVDQADDSTADTTTELIAPDLPELDFEAADFAIVDYKSSKAVDIRLATEENGEALNDALYRATRDVEETLNVDFRLVRMLHTDIPKALSQSVQAGDMAYDLLVPHCIAGVATMVKENLVMSWDDIPYVDFDKPYWNQAAIEELSIVDITPYAVGDYIISDPSAIMFNKDMTEDMGLDSTYDFVHDGTWTWDKMTEIASGIAADIDGDGLMTEDDRFGFAGLLNYQFNGITHACGQRVVEKDDEGVPRIVINNEKTVNVINKIYKLVYDSNASFTHRNLNNPREGFDFATGRTLYYLYDVSMMNEYRDCEVEFGIVPFPKYDETQEEYYSLAWDALMAAPIDADPEIVGAVSELLNFKSREYVYPAYYDTILNGKITRDEQSSEMLDIIFDGIVYEFGLNYSEFGNAAYLVARMMQNKTTDVASYYEANIRKEEQHYLALYEAVAD